MNLSVGHITYANCAPFFHYLDSSGFSGRIVPGVPSHLNRLLAEGEIDISPSSSFEYARGWRQYLLLPGQSISSRGPVQSVLLFSSRPLEELAGEKNRPHGRVRHFGQPTLCSSAGISSDRGCGLPRSAVLLSGGHHRRGRHRPSHRGPCSKGRTESVGKPICLRPG